MATRLNTSQEVRVAALIEDLLKEILLVTSEELRDDPNLASTPERVSAAMLREWFSGYSRDLKDIVTAFPNPGKQDLVVVKDIQYFSTCAHHMAPFFGKAAIAYVPDKSVVGLSKMARLVDLYARRLQLQETITAQVADALMSVVNPLGAMVVLYDSQHTCMTSRGVKAHESSTTTSAVRGIFETDAPLRQEALSLIFR